MSRVVRRARGTLLRLVKRRPLAVGLGLLLAAPAVWLQLSGAGTWWTDGLSVVLGATGVALVWSGLFGARPDWVE
jgi:hypothetical protein